MAFTESPGGGASKTGENADEITEMLMEPMNIADLPYKKGDDVLLLVHIVYRKAAQIAKQHGLNIVRNLIGSYITSLEMSGTSVTLLKMNYELTKLWDAPVDTPALRWS